MMADIFAGARLVVIWLAADTGVEMFLEMLTSTDKMQRKSWGNGKEKQGIFRRMLNYHRVKRADKFAAFFDRPYRQRMWIVQEIYSARALIISCGTRSYPWSSLESFQNRSWESSESYVPWETKGHQRRVQWFLSTKYDHARNPVDRNDPSFEELVGVFRGRRCRDPRDKVHALQGLLNESQSVEIDYGKPIRDVILDAGRVIMEASSNSIWFYPHVENHYEDLC
jgi:hypothetical protein